MQCMHCRHLASDSRLVVLSYGAGPLFRLGLAVIPMAPRQPTGTGGPFRWVGNEVLLNDGFRVGGDPPTMGRTPSHEEAKHEYLSTRPRSLSSSV
jgi:hypothetical protein